MAKRECRENQSFLTNLGKQIRTLRKQAGMTQQKLSELTGIACDKICLIERGEINTGVSNIPFIAEALGKSVTELLNFEYEKCILATKI